MIVTLSDLLLEQLRSQEAAEGLLYGQLRDEGDVAQIAGLSAAAGTLLGRWYRLPSADQLPSPLPDAGPLGLLVNAEECQGYQFTSGSWDILPTSIVRLQADYATRLNGLFESAALADACVAVIGLGSGGSVAATQLARCGVGHMRIVDYDRLEVQNIARHACSLADIGRYKTRAVRDLLLNISPLIAVATYEIDILAEPAVLAEIVQGCDLVVVATDSEESKLAINQQCWPLGIPAVYGAAYNRAFGGDVFRAVPPAGPCYNCFQSVVAEFFGSAPSAAEDFTLGYADPARMADLVAEPGMAIDVGTIALLLSRMALLTLLRGRASSLPDLPSDWVLLSNRAEWIFEQPLESLFVEVPKRTDCPVCNYESYVQQVLGMSAEDARDASAKLIDTLPQFRRPDTELGE